MRDTKEFRLVKRVNLNKVVDESTILRPKRNSKKQTMGKEDCKGYDALEAKYRPYWSDVTRRWQNAVREILGRRSPSEITDKVPLTTGTISAAKQKESLPRLTTLFYMAVADGQNPVNLAERIFDLKKDDADALESNRDLFRHRDKLREMMKDLTYDELIHTVQEATNELGER